MIQRIYKTLCIYCTVKNPTIRIFSKTELRPQSCLCELRDDCPLLANFRHSASLLRREYLLGRRRRPTSIALMEVFATLKRSARHERQENAQGWFCLMCCRALRPCLLLWLRFGAAVGFSFVSHSLYCASTISIHQGTGCGVNARAR